jgi:class 3 adenylate cyclase/tetratricopeptide (TPR) repeat protein
MSSRVERQGVMLFADIMNSAFLSYFLSAKEYDHLVDDFHNCAIDCVNRVMKDYEIKPEEIEYGCAGDELTAFLIAEISKTERIKELFKAVLDLAFRLKIMWLFSDTNVKRLEDHKAPTDMGVGIHIGTIMVQLPENANVNPHCEGYSITLCKRIESASREGKDCQIFLSQNARQLIQDRFFIHTNEVKNSPMKGIPSPPKLYEIVGFVFFDLSIPYVFLNDLVAQSQEPFEEWSERAMQICRQSVWYGLLTITLLHLKQRQKEAIATAEEMLQHEDNFSLLQYLGFIYDQLRMPERAVIYNEKALRINPYDIMSQFNLAVAVSHIQDSLEAVERRSKELWRRTIKEYKKTEQLLKAHSLLGRGSEYDWKIPLFTAHPLKGLARESHWERTNKDWRDSNSFLEQEIFWLRESLALYKDAETKIGEIARPRDRWLTECLFHCGEVHEMLGDKDGAKQRYRSCVTSGRKYLTDHQDPDVDYFVTQSEQRLTALETE